MRKSTPFKHLYRSYVMLIVTFVVLVIVSRWAWGHYERNTRAQELYNEASLKREKVDERLQTLHERNLLLDTETGKQDVLISRYALKLPGERVLILIEDDTRNTEKKEEKNPTVWERLLFWR